MDDVMTKEQIQAVHLIFAKLAEVTDAATSINDVARRMAGKGMITTADPCDSVWNLQLEIDVLFSLLSDEVWNLPLEEKEVE